MAELEIANDCCEPEAKATCCEPEAKESCCGGGQGCGCSEGDGRSPERSDLKEMVRGR